MCAANRHAYVQRLTGTTEAVADLFAYDVITEVLFDSRGDFEMMAKSSPAVSLADEADKAEAWFLDRAKTRFVIVSESDSKLPPNKSGGAALKYA